MPPYLGAIGRGIGSPEAPRARADRGPVRGRLRSGGGFGLIEPLMAMVMLTVGLLAIGASYNPGIISLNRARKLSTAATLADAQMEQYRALAWAAIALDPSTIPATAPYTTDAAYSTT